MLSGILFGLPQVYNIHLSEPVQHTFLSSTTFYGMRIICDALFFALLWLFFQRWRMQRLFDTFPDNPRDVPAVLDWIDGLTDGNRDWPGR